MRHRLLARLCGALTLSIALPVAAATPITVGLSASGARIEASSLPVTRPVAPTILLIGGLSGPGASVAVVRDELAAFAALRAGARKVNLIAIPLANPDGATLEFPPGGIAYRDHPESHALWRWIGVHAPDLVLIEGPDDYGLGRALSAAVAEVGAIPVQLASGPGTLLARNTDALEPSAARRELTRRLERTPRQLAEELAQFYGHDFDQPLYIGALALIAQLRLGHGEEVERLVRPYVDGTKDSLEHPSSLVLAGHLVFSALARTTAEARYGARVRAAADLGFEPDGRMKEAMPYHDGFSDSLFMGTVILTQAGALTGEPRYFDLAVRHVAFMRQLLLRPDGLYRHQSDVDAAWGRGNAFPAIGLALALSDLPRRHPGYPQLLRDYRDLMAVLARFQDADGLWRNVIDDERAYGEFSATAMIGFAMQRGVERGWLAKRDFEPRIARAWRAVLARVGPAGHLLDVCESTARMRSADDYLHRAATAGADPRGGAMALLFATELAGLSRGEL